MQGRRRRRRQKVGGGPARAIHGMVKPDDCKQTIAREMSSLCVDQQLPLPPPPPTKPPAFMTTYMVRSAAEVVVVASVPLELEPVPRIVAMKKGVRVLLKKKKKKKTKAGPRQVRTSITTATQWPNNREQGRQNESHASTGTCTCDAQHKVENTTSAGKNNFRPTNRLSRASHGR